MGPRHLVLLVSARPVDSRLLVGAGGDHVVESGANSVGRRDLLKSDLQDLDAGLVAVHQLLQEGLRVLLHGLLADGKDVVDGALAHDLPEGSLGRVLERATVGPTFAGIAVGVTGVVDLEEELLQVRDVVLNNQRRVDDCSGRP